MSFPKISINQESFLPPLPPQAIKKEVSLPSIATSSQKTSSVSASQRSVKNFSSFSSEKNSVLQESNLLAHSNITVAKSHNRIREQIVGNVPQTPRDIETLTRDLGLTIRNPNQKLPSIKTAEKELPDPETNFESKRRESFFIESPKSISPIPSKFSTASRSTQSISSLDSQS